MKIEMHCHTSEVSPCSHIPADELVKAYKAAGYDALVVTDHFNKNVVERFSGKDGKKNVDRYLLGYERARKAGQREGVRVLFGIETCLLGGAEDFLIYGADPALLYENPFLYEMSQEQAYACAHRYGALFFQAHPYRAPYCSARDARYLDGVEVFNAHPGMITAMICALAFAREHGLLESAGTDCHEYEHVGRSGIVTKERITDEKELAAYLLNGAPQLIRL